MKIQNYFNFFLVVICLFTFTQNAFSQENNLKEDFEKMSFEVNMKKTEYLMLEPISVRLKFSNKTNSLLKTTPPVFASDVRLRVNSNGKPRDYAPLFGYSIYQIRFPKIFRPN